MRLHITLEDEQRWQDIEAALGELADSAHEWDADPERWVREQREGDVARLG